MSRIDEEKLAKFEPKITLKKFCIISILFLTFAIVFVFYRPSARHFWVKYERQKLNVCPIRPPKLLGPFKPNLAPETLESVETRFKHLVELGGYYKPAECIARSRVAILITCRGQEYEKNVAILLKNLHRMLKRQQLEYQIFIIFQMPGFRFNKGALSNVGFVEAMKQRPFDCFIFHDADIIPMDDRNLYDCPRVNPRHLAATVDKNIYELRYEDHFAGVTVFTPLQYKRINGHSNRLWGWGGDDLDLFNRISDAGYLIERHPSIVAKYQSLKHEEPVANPEWEEIVKKGSEVFTTDGLNSLKYHIKEVTQNISFTSILVDFVPEELGTHSDKVKDKETVSSQ